MLDYGQDIFYEENSYLIIWNNRSILIQNRSIYFKDWAEKGVVSVHDLLDEEGNWLSFGKFSNKYNIRTNFLRYMGIISAVKLFLKAINVDMSIKPKNNVNDYEQKVSSGKIINLNKCKSKTFYLEFVNFALEPSSSLQKWSENYHLDESVFYNSLPLAKKCTRDRCAYCNGQDTMLRAMSECTFTLNGIRDIFSIIDPQKRFINNITKIDFIFGVQHSALNLVFLILKKYIIYV